MNSAAPQQTHASDGATPASGRRVSRSRRVLRKARKKLARPVRNLRAALKQRKRAARSRSSGIPKLLIFDFDGTIADTFEAGYRILNQLAEEFGFRRLERKDLERARDMRTRELISFLGIPARKMSRIARRGSEELHACMDGIKPLRGMPEAIRTLHAKGFSLGIITSNTEANVTRFLRNYDLELFDFMRNCSKLLGKAGIIRKVLRGRRVPIEDVLFVGDETRDIEAAQKAGIRMAAVTWGYNSRRSLAAMRPDLLFETPEALVEYLVGAGEDA